MIPEKTPERIALGKAYKAARGKHDSGDQVVPGLNEWNRRWVGEEGYKGIVARQLQEFKKLQREAALDAEKKA